MTGVGSVSNSVNAKYYGTNNTGTKDKDREFNLDGGSENDMLSMLQKGIKAYVDEHYSGLSEDDKKKIRDEIKKYLEAQRKAGIDIENMTEEDAKAFQAFVESLKKKYGCKGAEDLDEMAADAFGVVSKSQSALQYKFQTEMKVKDFEEFDLGAKEEKRGLLF